MSDTAEALARALRDTSFEAGGGIGYGETYSPGWNASNPLVQAQMTDKSSVAQAYALARNKLLGAEAGYLKLPEYHSRVYTPNYPAYKSSVEGISVQGGPTTADIRQDITATAPYVRANLYGPTIGGAEPYGFYGRAKVRTDNHEYGQYDGKDPADYRNTNTRNAPYYGLGANVPLGKNLNLRAEYGRIPKGSSEYHTGDRDISMGLLGLGYKW